MMSIQFAYKTIRNVISPRFNNSATNRGHWPTPGFLVQELNCEANTPGSKSRAVLSRLRCGNAPRAMGLIASMFPELTANNPVNLID